MKATLFTKKRIETKESKVDGILPYDIDNAYPNRVIDIINNSVTGVSCTKLYSKFIHGGGFKDKGFYKLQVNKAGLTNDKFLRILSDNFSKLGYVAIHINLNALFEAVEFTPIPSQYIRFTGSDNKEYPNMVVNYNNWDKSKSSRIKKEDFEYYNHFTVDHSYIQSQVDEAGGWNNYNGQIWVVSNSGAEYVLAPCDSVLEDMQTEGHAKIFKYRNITTNFLGSHFLITDKKENSGIERTSEVGNTTDDNGILALRESRETSRQNEAFINSIVDFQGADDALKIAVIEKDHPDQTFKLEKVEIQDVEDLYEFTENSVRDNIIRCFNQPPVLIGVKQGDLTARQRKDATDAYNAVTTSERIFFEEIFTKLFSIWHDKNVNPSGDFSIIPIQAKSELQYSDIQKVLDSQSSAEEKKQRLMILFDFTKEEVDKMVIEKTIN